MLINDDMDVEPRFLEALVDRSPTTASGWSRGITLQPQTTDVVDCFGIQVDCTLLSYNRMRHRSPDAQPGHLLGPSGGAGAYRRSAWDAPPASIRVSSSMPKT